MNDVFAVDNAEPGPWEVRCSEHGVIIPDGATKGDARGEAIEHLHACPSIVRIARAA